MYYIDTKFRSWLKRDVAISHIGPTLIVFAAFIGLTVWSSISAQKDVETKQSQILAKNIQDNKDIIEARLTTYEDVLRAGKGLFGASNNVTGAEWKQFVNSFELGERYSGIQSMGYAEVISGNNLESHVKSLKSQGLPSYNVRPAGERPVYVTIKYIESTNPNASEIDKNIGFDVYTDATRRQAMDQARDTGQLVITDIVRPLRPAPQKPDTALVMYMPIYAGNSKPATLQERRAALTGYIFSGFFTENLINFDDQDQNSNFGFRVYDGGINDESLLYQSPSYKLVESRKNKRAATESMTVNNQEWQIVGSASANVIPAQERSRPTTTLWGGALFSIFVASFIYMLLLNRSRMSFEEEQREIREAKDELLALASHQLRTPATGVKQYIGLLREGYAGKLSREQKTYVDKAYANNERQLATINKMLFVARANAKKIELRVERFDMRALAQSAIEDVQEVIKENQQKLTINLPAKKMYIEADNKYLRMCIENILSNAAKYTPDEGKITFTLKKIRKEIVIKISDTGVGVNEEDFPLLFRKFSRIPNEFTNKVNGSGIGLYLSKKVVEAHKGTIEFESEAGVGTTFIVKLPVNQKP